MRGWGRAEQAGRRLPHSRLTVRRFSLFVCIRVCALGVGAGSVCVFEGRQVGKTRLWVMQGKGTCTWRMAACYASTGSQGCRTQLAGACASVCQGVRKQGKENENFSTGVLCGSGRGSGGVEWARQEKVPWQAGDQPENNGYVEQPALDTALFAAAGAPVCRSRMHRAAVARSLLSCMRLPRPWWRPSTAAGPHQATSQCATWSDTCRCMSASHSTRWVLVLSLKSMRRLLLLLLTPPQQVLVHAACCAGGRCGAAFSLCVCASVW